MDEPLVTVAISAYNAGAWLRPSVESVLAQDHRALEVVVVDDGSTDGSPASLEGLRDPRLQVLHQANAGKSVALNRILEATSGEFVMIHDADDLSDPGRARAQVARLLAEPDLGACFTQFELLCDGRRLAGRSRGLDRDQCRAIIEDYRQPSIDPTLMFRRSAMPEGGFAPELAVGQCVDFILRLGEQHPMVVLDACLYSYRIHAGSNTRADGARTARFQAEVRRRAMARRGLTVVDAPAGDVGDAGSGVGPGPASSSTRHVVVSQSVEAVLDAREEGRRADALRTGARCLRLSPRNPDYAKALVYAVVPRRLLARLRPDRAAFRG